MSALVVVDSRVAVDVSGLGSDLVLELREEFSHENKHREVLKRMRIPYKGEPAIIETWTREGNWLTFPRGGLARVLEILRMGDVQPILEDYRALGDADMRGQIPKHRMTLYPDQEAVVQAAYAAETCIVKAPTGAGKSTCAFALASRVNLPTLVVVHNRGLFDQWVMRAESELGMKAGIIAGPKCDVQLLTVAMQKTLFEGRLTRFAGLRDTFGCLIADEIQLAPARTFFAAIDPFAAKWRVGFSADHRRKDGKEFLARDLFGDVAVEIGREQLEDAGRVLDVSIDVVPTNFRADWYGMPDTGEDKELDFGRLLDEMGSDSERNAIAAEHACLDVLKGEQVLVMAHRREHCQRLAAMLVANNVKTGFMIGGPDFRNEYVRTRDGLVDGTFRAAVGTFQAIGQGIDLPRVATVVAGSPIAGNRQVFQQVRGRVARTAKGKASARMVYLYDRAIFGDKHLRNLCAWNRTVRILINDAWVDARQYLGEARGRTRTRH